MIKRIVRFVMSMLWDEKTVIWKDKETGESYRFNGSDIPGSLWNRLGTFGLAKFLETRTSSVAPENKMESRRAVLEMLELGMWRKPPQRGGRIISIRVEALAELMGEDPEAVNAGLHRNESPERIEAILSDPKVKAQVKVIRERREAAADAGDDLDFAGFGEA